MSKTIKLQTRPVILIFLSLLLALSLVACGSNYHHNIFDNPNCKYPCWENITPGITTKADVVAILTDLEIIKQPFIDGKRPGGGFDDYIYFDFAGEMSGGRGWIDFREDKVILISLEGRWDLTIQEAISSFGIPQSVLAERAGEFEAISFFYPQDGIVFGRRFSQGPSEVRPKDHIYEVNFFDPTQYEQLLEAGFFNYSAISASEVFQRMRNWEGYGTIDEYLSIPTP
jgi:hypothetical protein